jgi:molecular chaperone GrpE (heat shock protein)
MLVFEIKGAGKYKICQDAKDITIKRFISIIDFEKKHTPKCLEVLRDLRKELEAYKQENQIDSDSHIEKWEAEIEKVEDSFDKRENEMQLIRYNIGLISLLSDCPAKTLEKVAYNEFLTLAQFAFAAIHQVINYQPKPTECLDFNGTKWYLPKENLTDLTLNKFLQANYYQGQVEQLKMDNYEAILRMLPVILKQTEDEQYDFDVCMQRKGLFDSLPVTDALDIAFFLTNKQQSSKISTLTFSIAGILSKLRRKKKQ